MFFAFSSTNNPGTGTFGTAAAVYLDFYENLGLIPSENQK
jgi:hypothetical protein